MSAAKQFECVGFRAACRGKLSRSQKSPCCQRIFSDLLGGFGQPELPAEIFRIELRDALAAKQRVFVTSQAREKFRGLAVLIDGFFRMILFLLQECVPRDAFRRLADGTASQKTIVDGQRLGFVARLDQQIEKKSVINRGAVLLVHPRVKISERLRRFLMLRRFIKHRQIRLDSVLDAVLFEESLGAVQMLADVCGHPSGLPLRCLSAD